jgi:hypothetical protein
MTAYGEPDLIPTPEDVACVPVSYYGVTKYAAERYVQITGARPDVDLAVTSLRMFNVYGPRQGLDNPYQGVLAIFLGNVLRGEPITIHGDGKQLLVCTSAKVSILDVASGKVEREIVSLDIHSANEKLAGAMWWPAAITAESIVWEWNGSVVVTDRSGTALTEVENAQFQGLSKNLNLMPTPPKGKVSGDPGRPPNQRGRIETTLRAVR